MAKKKNTVKKKQVSKETKEPSSKKKPDMCNSTTMMIVVALVVGLIIGGLVSYAFMMNGPEQGPAVIQVDELRTQVESYLNENLVVDDTFIAVIIDTNKIGDGLYAMNFEISQAGTKMGEGVVYATKDHVVLGQAFDLREPLELPDQDGPQDPPASLEKKDVPDAELYIFSYCPAGSAALDTFSEAADLLKETANVKVRFFSDMHGPYELQQNKIQSCIQDVDEANYWEYAKDFYEDVYSACDAYGGTADNRGTPECDEEYSRVLMAAKGIDADAVMACVTEKGDALYEADIGMATALSLQYSPSVVVNGVYLQNADRSADGIKSVVCSAYNEAPELCENVLDNQATAAGSCS
jgi:hypothetical protein